MRFPTFSFLALASLLLAPALPARAALIGIAPAAFAGTTQTVTFGTTDDDGTGIRTYVIAPGLSVGFGSYFAGQSLTTTPDDGGLYYLTGTTPSGPLTLVSNDDAHTVITTDASTGDPDNERLAGAAPGQFLGPVSILFSAPVRQVAFTAGVFSEAADLSIEAFTATGASLGTVSNAAAGDGRFYLADSGGADIAGLSLFIPDGSLNGFSINDVSATADVLPPPPPPGVPEPGTLPLLATVLLAGMTSHRVCRMMRHGNHDPLR